MAAGGEGLIPPQQAERPAPGRCSSTFQQELPHQRMVPRLHSSYKVSSDTHRKRSAMRGWVSMRGSLLARRASPGVRGAGAQEGESPDHVGQLLWLEAVPVAQAIQADGLQQLRAGVVEQPRKAPHAVGGVLQGVLHPVSTWSWPQLGPALVSYTHAASCKSETPAKDRSAPKPTPIYRAASKSAARPREGAGGT